MSESLKKSPSEGDIAKSLEENTLQESVPKKQSLRKAKSLAGINKSKRVASENSGVRIVWRTSSSAEFDSLNKVLGLPQISKQSKSLSPRASQVIPVDHVFSEHFNPLAVQRRDTIDLGDNRNTSDEEITSNIVNTSITFERKRQERDFGNLDMPSVKQLKSIFETFRKDSEINPNENKPIKRSHTISGHEIASTKKEAIKIHDLAQRRESTGITLVNSIDPVNTLPPIVSEQKIIPNEDKHMVDSINITTKFLNEPSKESFSKDIESEHVKSVKDLLYIFQNFSKTHSESKELTNKTSQNRNDDKIRIKRPDKLNLTDSYQITVKSNSEKTFDKSLGTGIPQQQLSNSELPQQKENKQDHQLFVELQHQQQQQQSSKKDANTENRDNSKEKIVYSSSQTVSNLKKKWENLMSVNPDKKKLTEKTITQERDTQNEKKISSDKENDQRTNGHFAFERRSSVKDITSLYETKKNLETKSVPTTPSTPRIDDLFQTKRVSIDYGSNSAPTSAKLNYYPPSKNLESLKQRYSIDNSSTEVDAKEMTKAAKSSTETENNKNNKKEMSLATLERKASVKNLKDKFEFPFVSIDESKQSKYDSKNAYELPSPGIVKKAKNSLSESEIEENFHKANLETVNISIKPEHNKNIDYITATMNGGVKIELNNDHVDINKNGNETKESSINKNSVKKNKIEELVRDFVASENLSQYLDVPKDESLSPTSNNSSSEDITQLMKATDTFKYPNFQSEKESNQVHQKTSDEHSLKSILPSSHTADESLQGVNKSHSKAPKLTKEMRSGSRELKPDELKFFQDLSPSSNTSNKLRERAFSIDSSSPSSTLSTDEIARSKLRSSSRQFRDLHFDEIPFFGVAVNGSSSKPISKSSSDVTFRQSALGSSFKSSTLDDAGRKE